MSETETKIAISKILYLKNFFTNHSLNKTQHPLVSIGPNFAGTNSNFAFLVFMKKKTKKPSFLKLNSSVGKFP